MRFPISARSGSGMLPASSIVRYEMQRRASSSYGATIAPVGHAVDAGRARTAMRADRRRHGQRQIGVDLAEKEIRAHVARQEQRVLAAPAESRARGERHFEHRRAVGEHAAAERADVILRFGRASRASRAEAPGDSRGRARNARRTRGASRRARWRRARPPPASSSFAR